MEVLGQRRGWPPETHPTRFRRCYALRLPLSYVQPLVLRNEAQHLQNDVAEKRSHQILAAPRIQQRHIQHHDVYAFLLCQHAPLLQNLCVIPPETVYALDAEQVVSFHFAQQLFVLRPVEVLARLLVHVDVTVGYSRLMERDALPVIVLLPAADPYVSVCAQKPTPRFTLSASSLPVS